MTRSLVQMMGEEMKFLVMFKEWMLVSDKANLYALEKLEKEDFFERHDLMLIIHESSGGDIIPRIKNLLEQTSLSSYETIRIVKSFRFCIEQKLGISTSYRSQTRVHKTRGEVTADDMQHICVELRKVSERDALIFDLYRHLNDMINVAGVRGYVSLEQIVSIIGEDINYEAETIVIPPKDGLNEAPSKFGLSIELLERFRNINYKSDGLVFRTSRGSFVNPRHLRRSFRKAAENARCFSASGVGVRRPHS